MDSLLTTDFSQLFGLLWEIIIDPASRPGEALLLYGMIVIALVMVLLVVVLLITRHTADDDEFELEDEESEPGAGQEQVAVAEAAQAEPPASRRRLPVSLVVLVAVLGWWLVTGLATSSTAVCLGCHADSKHAVTQAAVDPHGDVACVSCHDSGGWAAMLTFRVPSRVMHVASATLSEQPRGSYGYVGGEACSACHAGAIAETTTNEARAVRMSHTEPLAAGAECGDCHRSSDGVIGTTTTKMQPCLRCHNNVDASAKCASCHTGDIALAVVGRSVPTTATAEPLVVDIDCGSCHTSQESCDACHGIRLPHTQEFMDHAHARPGVEDLWHNGGRTCGKCHNSRNRPCTQCHKGVFLSHGSGFAALHGSQSSGAGCDTCHGAMAWRNGRDFCELCHKPGQ